MSRLRPAAKKLMTEEQLEKVNDSALQLIKEQGIKVEHAETRDLLAKESGVTVKGEYVCFEPEKVEWAIGEQVYPQELYEMDFAIISGAYELNVNDLETGEIRPATVEDLVNFTKLADSYGMYGSAPVRPTDIKNSELQEILNYKISWENSSRKCNTIFEANEKSTLRVAKYVYEMAQAAKKRFSLGIWIKSPFKISHKEMDIIFQFRKENVPLFAATMPIMGMTAPVFMPGAYVQSTAELFAGVTLLKTLSPESDVYSLPIDSIRAYPLDFKHMSFVYGSPEDLLATSFQIELNNYYNIPVVAKSLLTTSKQADAHAAAEKMAHTLSAALAGARIFTNAGLLAVDEIYSGEQLVIDYEIVQYVKRVIQGFEFDEETLALDIIKRQSEKGKFLEDDSTLQNYTDFWVPDLFERSSFSQWRQSDKISLKERAREIARSRIKNHDYQISEEIQSDLDKIYQQAEEEILAEK